MADPRDLVPRDKHDLNRVAAVRDVGYPGIAPVLDELMTWTFDANWPVAPPLAAYLCSLGRPIVAPISAILGGSDEQAKYYWLGYLPAYMPRELARTFTDDLLRLAISPTKAEGGEEIDLAALEVLAWLRWETT